jgi:membrane protein required for beta-lactamase induction
VIGIIGMAPLLLGMIVALATWGGRRFMRRVDNQLSARDAGDANAARRLRRLHWSVMPGYAVLLVALVATPA